MLFFSGCKPFTSLMVRVGESDAMRSNLQIFDGNTIAL